jgi:hemolysin activation/secretion protein
MQLGGISGVRAFPANEFFCDDAELVTVELSRSIWKYISAGVFYDIGSGYANHYNYSNSSNNQRTLQDVGFNITAMKSRDWAIKGTAAFKLYNDPNQSQPDNSWQGWIQAVKYF